MDDPHGYKVLSICCSQMQELWSRNRKMDPSSQSRSSSDKGSRPSTSNSTEDHRQVLPGRFHLFRFTSSLQERLRELEITFHALLLNPRTSSTPAFAQLKIKRDSSDSLKKADPDNIDKIPEL